MSHFPGNHVISAEALPSPNLCLITIYSIEWEEVRQQRRQNVKEKYQSINEICDDKILVYCEQEGRSGVVRICILS